MGKWMMFPDPDEQHRILAMPVEKLAPALIDSNDGKADLLIAGVYDLFYGAVDIVKALDLLNAGVATLGKDVISQTAGTQILFSIAWDGQSVADQIPFRDFCRNAGLEMPELIN